MGKNFFFYKNIIIVLITLTWMSVCVIYRKDSVTSFYWRIETIQFNSIHRQLYKQNKIFAILFDAEIYAVFILK